MSVLAQSLAQQTEKYRQGLTCTTLQTLKYWITPTKMANDLWGAQAHFSTTQQSF